MRFNLDRLPVRLLCILVILLAGTAAVHAQTTSFSYQGRLTDGGTPADGTYDLKFTLWDALSGGNQQPQAAPVTVTRNGVPVSNGVFTVQLDFGSPAFSGADRFLEIEVKKPADATYTTLTPRQQISSSPYAIMTLKAAAADSLSSDCVGCVSDGNVANGISYSKLSGAPTSLPPSGAAGGDLTGTYPNPTIANNAVTSAKIADGTIQGSDLAAGTFTTTNSHRALGNNDNVARELRLLEPSGSGVNYSAFKAQAQAGDITYTLPNTAPTGANQVLQVQSVAGNNATLSWGSIGGGAIIFNRTGVIANAGNTSYTVQPADDIVGVDMSAGTNFTVHLPPATTTGEILIIKIEKFNNATLPILTVQPNGTDKIDGRNNDAFGNAGGHRSYYSDGAGNWYSW